MGIISFLTSACSFNSMFYYPDREKTDIQDVEGEEGFIRTSNGKQIHYVFVKSGQSEPIATIYVLHGNAGNLGGWSSVAIPFTKAGYQVFIIDYQGFGKSEGSPTHKNILDDSRTALDFLLARPDVDGTKLIVIGYSIGGQPAIALTVENQDKIDALVVEGTFTSYKGIAMAVSGLLLKPFAALLVHSPYNAGKLIREIKIPKLIIHSTDDKVIPFRMGVELWKNAQEPKELWKIKGEHLEGIDRYKTEYMERIGKLIGR